MNVQTGYLQNVDGSCLYETKYTKVISSVTGPIEPKARQELPTQLAIELNIRPAAGVPTTREVNIQDKVRAVITPILVAYKYPRRLCQITLQLLQAGETETYFHLLELISCINSSVFALIDSGIALNSIALGVPVVVTQDDSIIMEPSNDDLKIAKSIHAVVFQVIENKPSNVLLMDSLGDFDESTIFKVLESAEGKTIELNKSFREIIKNKITSI